jgi:D-3-phosphoglycerate dehydrogenase / 2-oxoglutarate reductase
MSSEISGRKILIIDTVHPLFTAELTRCGFECTDGTKLSEQEILERIHEFEGIQIRSRIRIDRAFLDKAARLEFIARAGAGMESIDEKYAAEKGIACLSAPEGNSGAVGEHAVAMLLALFNNIPRADAEVREGIWNREANRGIEIEGKTIGIIGYGNMGCSFAKKISGFGAKVMAYDKYKEGYSDRYATESSMEDIFTGSDIISLHVPLTEETHHLVNDHFISRFAKPFFLINTARGKIVSTRALINALNSGRILGACLDVIEYETHSFERLDAKTLPADYRELLRSEKVVLSPHIAGWTRESKEKIPRVLVEKIKRLYGLEGNG